MNFMIHAISTNMGGAKRHLDNMVETLSKLDKNNQYYIIVNDLYETSWQNKNIHVMRYPIGLSTGIKRIWFDNITINRLIERLEIDLLISFGNIGPFKPVCKHILFEMNALYFCRNIRKLVPVKHRIDFFIKRVLIYLSGMGADLIITPSHSLKNQLIQSLGFNEKKIEVLYHAVDDTLFTQKRVRTNNEGHKKPIQFLYPSHLAPHKGVHVLVEALNDIQQRHLPLPPFEIICTFSKEDEPDYYDEMIGRIEHYGLTRFIRFIGHVPQSEINHLYTNADFMIYTTLCESFGFALIEAKASHLPALCSDIAVNREIAKGSAKYYHSEDSKDLADKIVGFLTDPPRDFEFDEELKGWIRVITDGFHRYDKFLKEGEVETIGALKTIKLRLGNAGGVVIEANGEKFVPGKPGEPKTVMVTLKGVETY